MSELALMTLDNLLNAYYCGTEINGSMVISMELSSEPHKGIHPHIVTRKKDGAYFYFELQTIYRPEQWQ